MNYNRADNNRKGMTFEYRDKKTGEIKYRNLKEHLIFLGVYEETNEEKKHLTEYYNNLKKKINN